MFEESSVNIFNWHKVKLGKSLEVAIVNNGIPKYGEDLEIHIVNSIDNSKDQLLRITWGPVL